jgi:DNA-directed RNA polymerase sigma subunit (sigma70/sigma32)
MIAYGEKYTAMTFEQIAKALGVTTPAIISTYHRAIRKLRRNPEAMAVLRCAMAQHERSKPQERVYPDWGN